MENANLKIEPRKRKTIPDHRSSSSSANNDAGCHGGKCSHGKAKKSKEIFHRKFVENKKFQTSSKRDEKRVEKLPKKCKKFVNQKEDKDKQIELEIWYYLLHHLEESEKLIALKLLEGIKKMKKNWKDSVLKSEYVDKKEVDDLKLIIKTLLDEREKYEIEKQELIRGKNDLEKMIAEERKRIIQLEEILAKKIEKSKEKEPKQIEAANKIEVLNKIEDKQQSQTTTEIVFKQKPSTSTVKISSNDGNNNNQVLKKIGDINKEVDLREILNERENGGIRERNMNLVIPPIRNFSSFVQYPRCKRIPPRFNEQLCLDIHTTIQRFPELMRVIENILRMPIRFCRSVATKKGWKIEFLSPQAKMAFFNKRMKLAGAGIRVTRPYMMFM